MSARTNAGRHPWTQAGVLRFTEGQDIDNLNPLLTTELLVTDLSSLTQGYLFLYDRRNELVPSLALAVPTQANGLISHDGRRFVYHLRRGVVWHDGAPFSAADIAFSVKTILDRNVNVSSTVGFDDIARLETPDDYTVIVYLKKPNARFVSRFLTPGIGSGILPKHLLDGHEINRDPFNGKPIGLGPFKYVRWNRGSDVEMEAFDRWWGGRPKLRRIVYKIVTEANSAFSQLRTGELDVVGRFSNTQYDEARAIPNTRTIDFATNAYEHINFNNDRLDLQDLRVRRALAHAMDLRTIVAKANHGQGVITCTPVPYFSWKYDPKTRCYPYDLKRAGQLLDEAGWQLGADGLRRKGDRQLHLELVSTVGNPSRDQGATLIQASFRAIGVQLDYRRYQANQLFAKRTGILDRGLFDLALFAWYWGPDAELADLYACDERPPKGQNSARYCNREVDRLLELETAFYDRKVRRRYGFRAQELIADDVPAVVVYQSVGHLVANDDFKHLDPGPILLFSHAAQIEN